MICSLGFAVLSGLSQPDIRLDMEMTIYIHDDTEVQIFRMFCPKKGSRDDIWRSRVSVILLHLYSKE